MGRQQYLTRFALGRSPYEELDSEATLLHQAQGASSDDRQLITPTHRDGEEDTANDTASSHHQLYDAKGRPTNPATEARNAELRRAQNDVLALVGVVEKKEKEDSKLQKRLAAQKEDRAALLAKENECGDDLELFIYVLSQLPKWTEESLVKRILAGVYDAGAPLARNLELEWRRLTAASGFWGVYAVMWPGTAASLLHLAVRNSVVAVIEEGISRLQNRLIKARWSKRMEYRTFGALTFLSETLILGVDVALLPLMQWALLQQLGFIPAAHFLPPIQAFHWNRDDPHSFHAWSWHSTLLSRSVALSPAGLMLLWNYLTTDSGSDDDNPILQPSPDDGYVLENPAGGLTLQMYYVRTTILRYIGWDVTPSFTFYQLEKHEDDVATAPEARGDDRNHDAPEELQRPRVHRSTTLARMPAKMLQVGLDGLLRRVMMLPLEVLMLRTLTQSFVQSPAALLYGTSMARSGTITPLVHDGLKSILDPTCSIGFMPSARQLGWFASKVGLALALDTGLEMCLFHAAYWFARWQGRTRFGWGGSTLLGLAKL